MMFLKKERKKSDISPISDVVRLNPGKCFWAADVGRDTLQTGEHGHRGETLDSNETPPPPLVRYDCC